MDRIEPEGIPEGVREIMRLQNQRVMRLEGALKQLLEVLESEMAITPGTKARILSVADGSKQQEAIERLVPAEWEMYTEEGRWSRLHEPEGGSR